MAKIIWDSQALNRKHWKLIYFLLEGDCHIAVVWDTRNNPDAMLAQLGNS